MKHIWKGILAVIGAVLMINCQNEDYLQDGGTHNPYYSGTVLDYITQHPDKHYFSELTDIVHYAGLDSVLQNEEITFFAPTDWSIDMSVDYLNYQLYWRLGQDSIKDLHQIRPEVWKEYLSMYIVPGKYCLKDIPQLDTASVSAYPGGAYYSLAKVPMNMGVVYYDAGNVKYAGARQILYSYVYDFTTMDMVNAYVSSCDIQPDNGVVHVIRFIDHYFGFDRDRLLESVVNAGILPLDQIRRDSTETIQDKKEG
ncbi:MAG: fasciclin domain-containing protein [Paraprevotella sp.]|nr:fasciclin domain-containing protein [Paraprevotella sp.]